MVFPCFGNPRRILRVLPQPSRFLWNLWLPAPRRGTQENLLQKCAEARPRHRPKGLPGLGFRLHLLELGEGKPSRPVLRGLGGRKAVWLLGSKTNRYRTRSFGVSTVTSCRLTRTHSKHSTQPAL